MIHGSAARPLTAVQKVGASQDQTGTDLADADLVERCLRGEESAWSDLVARYERLVFSIALREGLTTEDAADVAQTVFEALLKAVRSARTADNLAAWLVTVTRRQSWRIRTTNSRHGSLDGDNDLTHLPVTDRTAEIDSAVWVYGGLQRLGEPCRSLLLALYFEAEEPSYAEIAARLGRPVGSIGPTRARCLERLRDALGGDPIRADQLRADQLRADPTRADET